MAFLVIFIGCQTFESYFVDPTVLDILFLIPNKYSWAFFWIAVKLLVNILTLLSFAFKFCCVRPEQPLVWLMGTGSIYGPIWALRFVPSNPFTFPPVLPSPSSGRFLTQMHWSILSWRLGWDPVQISGALSLYSSHFPSALLCELFREPLWSRWTLNSISSTHGDHWPPPCPQYPWHSLVSLSKQ